jgi:hypothetical protein
MMAHPYAVETDLNGFGHNQPNQKPEWPRIAVCRHADGPGAGRDRALVIVVDRPHPA